MQKINVDSKIMEHSLIEHFVYRYYTFSSSFIPLIAVIQDIDFFDNHCILEIKSVLTISKKVIKVVILVFVLCCAFVSIDEIRAVTSYIVK